MTVKLNPEIDEIMDARFGCDSLIALATSDGSTPHVRTVNAYYEDGSFYIITYALSGKMKQIAANPAVAICGDWFTAHGTGENMGHILAAENADMAEKLRTVFAEWYGNGHVNESDPNTCILRIRLTDGVLFDHGTKSTLRTIEEDACMSRTENIELTTLCLICSGDKVLLQNRVKADWQGYTLPGGHVEPDESIVEATVREMKEETGLTIRNPRLCGVKQFPIEGGRYIVFLYRADEFEGELVSSDEGQMAWFDRSELTGLNTVDDFAELMRVFDEDALSEFQYVLTDEKWIVRLR